MKHLIFIFSLIFIYGCSGDSPKNISYGMSSAYKTTSGTDCACMCLDTLPNRPDSNRWNVILGYSHLSQNALRDTSFGNNSLSLRDDALYDSTVGNNNEGFGQKSMFKTMKIFSITHDKRVGDYYLGHVIVANNENEVRELAKKDFAAEGDDIWDIATVTIEGEYTGNKTEPFKLLSDFNAGM